MAQHEQVRAYLACWFQLGKGVVIHRTGEVLCPYPVLQGNHYSPEFESCWQRVAQQECYLEGTCQWIADLLSGHWDLVQCPRCSLLVPQPQGVYFDMRCPCHDLPGWPNTAIPQPRAPISIRNHLRAIQSRIRDADRRYQNHTSNTTPNTSPDTDPSHSGSPSASPSRASSSHTGLLSVGSSGAGLSSASSSPSSTGSSSSDWSERAVHGSAANVSAHPKSAASVSAANIGVSSSESNVSESLGKLEFFPSCSRQHYGNE